MRAFCRIAARDGQPGRARSLAVAFDGFIDAGPAPASRGSRAGPWWAGRGGGGYCRDQPGLLPRAAPTSELPPGRGDARHVFA